MEPMNTGGRHGPKLRHHGAGSVPFRRHDHHRNRPYAVVLSLGRDESGRRIRQWFYGATKAAAEHERDEALRHLRGGASAEGLRLTVAELLEAWLAAQVDVVRPSTWDRYAGAVTKWVIPALGETRLVALTADDIRRAMAGWGTPHNRGYVRATLSRALTWGIGEHYLAANPAENVRPPRYTPAERPTIGPEQAQAFLAAVADDVYGVLVLVLLGLGLRRGEALGLHWSDVDLEARTATIRWSLRRIPPDFRTDDERAHGLAYRLVEPKSARSTRTIPLSTFVASALVAHRERQLELRRAAKRWAENDLVFCDAHGAVIPPQTVTHHVQTVIERAGLGHIRLHDFRHGMATLLGAEGVHPKVQMALLGHTTERQSLAYTHVVPASARAAVEAVGTALRVAK